MNTTLDMDDLESICEVVAGYAYAVTKHRAGVRVPKRVEKRIFKDMDKFIADIRQGKWDQQIREGELRRPPTRSVELVGGTT